MYRSAMRLGSVFDQPQAVPLGDHRQRRHVAGHAIQVNRHDANRALGDRGLDGGGIHVPGIRRAIDQYRRSAAVVHGVGGRDVRERRHDDLIARLEVERHQRQMQRGRAVASCQCVRGPGELREVALELLEVRAL